MIHMIVKDLSEVTYAVKEVIKRAKEVLGLDEQIKIVDIDEAVEHDIEGIGLGVSGYGVRTLSPKQLVSRGTSLTFLVQAITRYIDPKSYEELVEGKNYFVCDLNTLEDLIDMYKEEKEPRTIALDIETAGNVDRDPFASGQILSIAIYDATEDKAFVVPEALAENEYVYDLLQALQGHQIVCHNGTFDMPYLSHRIGTRIYHQDDTLLMHYVLFNTAQEHGLKPLAQRWLNAPDWDSANDKYLKGGAHYEYIPRKQLYLYNAYDVVWTYRLYRLFHAMLEEQPEMRAYYEYRMQVSKMLQDVQLNGVPVDVDVLDELEEHYSAIEEETLTFLRSQAGQTFNPRSTKQLKEFFAAQGVHEKSFKEDVLKKLRRDRPDLAEFIDTLLKYRSATKVLSSYISTVRGFVGNDGRVHPTYLPHGAKTGRLSAKSPAIQTMGRDSGIKRALYAPEGYKIISCDYSQAELRTVAELSDDANMMSAFQPGAPDFFDDLMTKVYPEEFPTIADYEAFDRENHLEAKNKRALIKSIVYGSNYGRGAKAIAIALEKPVEDAEHVLDMYYSAYPNLKKWQDSIRESVGNDSLAWRTITPFGLRFKQEVVTYKNQNSVGNEALAFVPQSTANDICLHAAIEINKRVGQYGAQLIGLVHDATYVLCPEDKVEECSKMMENEMRGAARLVFHRVPFEAEAEVGDSWAEV